MESVARVQGGFSLYQIAGKKDFRLRIPDHDVTGRVASPAKLQLNMAAAAAELDPCLIPKSHCRASEAGNAIRFFKQARHPPEFTVPVFLAAFLDQFSRYIGSDDVLGAKGGSAQHTNGVIVG